MSGTRVVALTEKQRAWANAFLDAMGETGTVPQAPPPGRFGRRPVPEKSTISGDLSGVDSELDNALRNRLARHTGNLANPGENIAREGGSKDRGYRKNVREPVDDLLDQVDAYIADNTIEVKLEALKTGLENARRHYAQSLKGESNRDKAEQRQRKIEAIGQRLDAIESMQREAEAQQQERSNAILMMQPEERSKMLLENPDIRRGVIAAKPSEDTLWEIAEYVPSNKLDDFINELVDAHANDQAYMERMCGAFMTRQAAKEKRETYFRSNVGATKLAARYARNAPGCQEFEKDLAKDRDTWLKSLKSEVELRELHLPEKTRNKGTTEIQRAINQSYQQVTRYVDHLLEKIYATPLPRAVLTTGAMMKATAEGSGLNDAVPTMIAAQIVLRVINPILVSQKGGKDLQGPERSAMTLVSKIMQNIANGTLPGTKEADYKLLDGYVAGKHQEMAEWLLEKAEEGQRLLDEV